MSQRFTTEELVGRWEDRREIANTMVRFISQDYLLRREKDMYDTYWSRAEDVCLGVNEGYYAGAEAVKGYYEALHRRTQLESELIQKKYPTRLGEKSDQEIYGVGVLRAKPLDTPVIEIAADGQTAKGIWALRAMNTDLTPSGQISYWEWGWIAADFVLEENNWKVWHLLYLQDLYIPSDASWADSFQQKVYPEDPVYAPLKEFQFPEPNIKRVVRERYHTRRPFTPTPDYPVPYETFAETFSYGIQ